MVVFSVLLMVCSLYPVRTWASGKISVLPLCNSRSCREFGIKSALISNASFSPVQFGGNFQFDFTIKNPYKKVAVHYEQVMISLYFKLVFLAERIIEPFNQGTKQESKVKSNFVLNGYCTDCKPVGNSTSENETGLVGLEVRMLCWASLNARFSWGRTYWVLCNNVKVMTGNGSNLENLSGGAEKCKVILM